MIVPVLKKRFSFGNDRGNLKIAPIVLFAGIFVSVLCGASNSSILDSLGNEVYDKLKLVEIDKDSLYSAYITAIAKNDWSIVPGLSVAVSISFYDTPDSAIWDVAYAMARIGRITEALNVLEQAENIAGKMPQTVFLNALLLNWQGKKNKAIEILEKALTKVETVEESYFLKNALGILFTLNGNIQEAFSIFRRADRLAGVSSSIRPFVECKLSKCNVFDGFITSEIELRHISGKPFVILQIIPKFISIDRREIVGEPLYIEQIAQIFGSPYWQANVRRKGNIVFGRESGAKLSFGIELSAIVTYSDKKQDTLRIPVSGLVGGMHELDSFAVAVRELEPTDIERWYYEIISNEEIPQTERNMLYLTRTMAIAFMDSSMRAMALRVADSVLSVNPYWSAMWQWRGAIALAQNNAESALLSFLMTVKKDTCDEVAYYNAGVVHYLFGNFTSAESLWTASIKCNPSFPPAVLALGILNHDVKSDTTKALEYYRKYLTLTSFIKFHVETWIMELEKK